MNKARPLSLAIVAAVLASTTLSACVPVVVAGGAVAGTLAASDRRTLGAQTEDKSIVVKAEVKMPNIAGKSSHVNVNSFNRRVLLTGEVPDDETKAKVEREVRAIEGVMNITNELEVGFSSSYTSRSSDALITSKVKLSLADAKDISANSFKVITEKGAVFLMGRVTQREGAQAADIARGVAGVTKVVKVFEYISEDDVKQYQPSQQASQG
ncbi:MULTISPECIES: BON domain-containing protein [unclassified Duganella]|uniref:BON domain-containing protein n=1 Tax=unclassified Duganella TaxID=2636909 RepID=UPI0006F462A7|nr:MULTISPECIES: BON domain-containing protein [unclassified Duganella]KQV43072.1 transporter [Duganella sp. Root336D2]KRB97199.1 transporter [Duganella sp. Root198D2]